MSPEDKNSRDLSKHYRDIMMCLGFIVCIAAAMSHMVVSLLKTNIIEGEALFLVPVIVTVVAGQWHKSWLKTRGICHNEFMRYFSTQPTSRVFYWIMIISSILMAIKLISTTK